MREILFRGKRADNGEWVEGNLFIPDLERSEFQICIGTHIVRISYTIDPNTIGQFTGLTDKNGKKIFEGDVVRELICGGFETDNKYAVAFQNGRGGWYPFANGDGCGCCEQETFTPGGDGDVEYVVVIGNIHDNPELLGEST